MNSKEQIYLRKDFEKALKKAKIFNLVDKNGKVLKTNMSQRYWGISTKDSTMYMKLNKIFKHFHNKNVIDLGCNIGFFSFMIAAFANKVVGLDIGSPFIDKANKVKKYLGTENIEFFAKDINSIDGDYLDKYAINAAFFHKIGTYNWGKEECRRIYGLLADRCSIVVTNEIKTLEKFLEKKGYERTSMPSYKKTLNIYMKKD